MNWFIAKEEEEYLKNNGYQEKEYKEFNYSQNERVFVHAQTADRNIPGRLAYGYIEAYVDIVYGSSVFITVKEFYTGSRWTNEYLPKFYTKVLKLVKPEFKEVETKKQPMLLEDKKGLDEWYKNLSIGNRRAVDLITSGDYDKI